MAEIKAKATMTRMTVETPVWKQSETAQNLQKALHLRIQHKFIEA